MAHSNSARKRVRQDAARRAHKRSQMSALRTQVEQALAAAGAGNKDTASSELAKSAKALDRAAQKGLIHKNQAARRKSRLTARVSRLDS